MPWIISAWWFRLVRPLQFSSGQFWLTDSEAPGRAQYELDMTLEEETTGKMGLTEFLVNGLRIQDAQYVFFKSGIKDVCSFNSVGSH